MSSMPLIMRANIKRCRRTSRGCSGKLYLFWIYSCNYIVLCGDSFRIFFTRIFFFIIYVYTHTYVRARIRHINFSSRCSKTVSHMAIISRSLSLDIFQTSIFSASRSYSISLSRLLTRCRPDAYSIIYVYIFEGFVYGYDWKGENRCKWKIYARYFSNWINNRERLTRWKYRRNFSFNIQISCNESENEKENMVTFE